MPRRRESAISEGKRGLDDAYEDDSDVKKQKTEDDADSIHDETESGIVIEDPDQHEVEGVIEIKSGTEGQEFIVVENDGNPLYEVTRSSEGQDHDRKEPPAAGRNLSLEALFQVTDTELQAMTKQAHHILVPPDFQSETVIESSQSEQSGDERLDLVGQSGVYRQEGVVSVQGDEEGVEKYELQSQTLEQEGLKLVYTRQADSVGRGPLTITGFAPYQSGYASGKETANNAQATSHQMAPGASGFVVLDSTGSEPGTEDTQKEVKRAVKPSSKAGGTVQGHVKVRTPPSKPGKHFCPYCHRACAKPSVLEKHIRAHTGERPYPCDACGFSFKTKSNLYKHCKSRAHVLKVGIESKKRKITFGNLEDGAVNEIEISTERGEIDTNDSETESGDENVNDKIISVLRQGQTQISSVRQEQGPTGSLRVQLRQEQAPVSSLKQEQGPTGCLRVELRQEQSPIRQEQAPTHVLKQVAEFLGKAKNERPKVETEKPPREGKQKKMVQRSATLKSMVDLKEGPEKKLVVRSFSVPSQFSHIIQDQQGIAMPSIIQDQHGQAYSDGIAGTPTQSGKFMVPSVLVPGPVIVPSNLLQSGNFKIQIPRVTPHSRASKDTKLSDRMESVSRSTNEVVKEITPEHFDHSKELKSIESLESSYKQIEMVTLPSPGADEETINKSLRDLEAMSEKFKNAFKEGVRLQTSIENLPDKRIRVMIKVKEPAGRSTSKLTTDAQAEPTAKTTKSEKSLSTVQTPSIKGITTAELKERISQLISANEAIIDSPKIEPPRPKLVKRSFSRQESETDVDQWNRRYSVKDSSHDSGLRNVGENVIVERLENDGESIFVLSNKDDDGDNDPVEQGVIETQPTQSVANSAVLAALKEKVRIGIDRQASLEDLHAHGLTQIPFLSHSRLAKPAGESQAKQLINTDIVNMTSNTPSEAQIHKSATSKGAENVFLLPVSPPALPVTQPILMHPLSSENNQQSYTSKTSVLPFPTTKLIISSQPEATTKSISLTTPPSALSATPSVAVPGQVGKMALKNMKLKSKSLSLSSSYPSSDSSQAVPLTLFSHTLAGSDRVQAPNTPLSPPLVQTPIVSLPGHVILQAPATPQTLPVVVQTPITPQNRQNQAMSVVGKHQQGNVQHFLVRSDSVPLLLSNSGILQSEPQSCSVTTTNSQALRNLVPVSTAKSASRPSSLPTPLTAQAVHTFDANLLSTKPTNPDTIATIDPETKEIKIQINLHPVSSSATSALPTSVSSFQSNPELRRHLGSRTDTLSSPAGPPSIMSPLTFRFPGQPTTPSSVTTPSRPRSNPVFRFGKPNLSSPSVIQSPQHRPVLRFQTAQKTKSGEETVTEITDPKILHELLTGGKVSNQWKLTPDLQKPPETNTDKSDSGQHQSSESQESPLQIIYGPHKCNFCGIAFRKEETLNLHLLYYCKVRHHVSSGPDLSSTVDMSIIAKMFSQSVIRSSVNVDEKVETRSKTPSTPSKTNLVFENFEPSIWPKKKTKVKIAADSEKENKGKEEVSVIATSSNYKKMFPPLKRSKSEILETRSPEALTPRTRMWEQKLKGQILRRKLKGKLLMKRSLSFDASALKESPEKKTTKFQKAGGETKTEVAVKQEPVSPVKKVKTSTAAEPMTYRLRKPVLRRSESVPAKRTSPKEDETGIAEKKQKKNEEEDLPEVVKAPPEVIDISWKLNDVSVPVMHAPCVFGMGTTVRPIYQQNLRMRAFEGMGTPFSLVPTATLTPRLEFANVENIMKKFRFDSTSVDQKVDSKVSGIDIDTEKPKTTEKQTPKTPISAKSPNSLLSLTLLGHSYPTLRNLTHISFCCLNRLQPMYVCGGRTKKVSMYSNWCIAKHNPNPFGLSAKILLSLYNSRYTTNPVEILSCGASQKGGVITHSSYWQFKQTHKSSNDIGGREMQATKVVSESTLNDSKKASTDVSAIKTPEGKTKVIRIFKGGYKSLEPYTYVRGRGRGKYVCESCGIRCKKPCMLKKHIRTHTDLRPYSCHHCQFSFKTKGNLTKHMKSKAHQKKCIMIGIVPVPIHIDDSQINMTELEAQCSLSKNTQIAPGGAQYTPGDVYRPGSVQEEEDDDEDEDDNAGDEEEDWEDDETDKHDDIEIEIVKDDEQSIVTSSPSSVLEKRKFFLEALGVIAKQPSSREPITKISQGTVSEQMGAGTSLAPPAVSSAAKVASDLTTVYDLGKLSSSQQEGGNKGLKKDHEVILSLLGGATKGKDVSQETVRMVLTSAQSQNMEKAENNGGDKYVDQNTSDKLAKGTSTSQPEPPRPSHSRIPVKIPLGGFGPPVGIKDTESAVLGDQSQMLAQGPIVGQLIRQDSNTGSKLGSHDKVPVDPVFIPFQFQHPFSTSEDMVASPVKFVMSPDKKLSMMMPPDHIATSSGTLSLLLNSKTEGLVKDGDGSSGMSNVLIPVTFQKGSPSKPGVGLSKVQAEIINVDPKAFELNAKACTTSDNSNRTVTANEAVDSDDVFIVEDGVAQKVEIKTDENSGLETKYRSILGQGQSSGRFTISSLGNWHRVNVGSDASSNTSSYVVPGSVAEAKTKASEALDQVAKALDKFKKQSDSLSSSDSVVNTGGSSTAGTSQDTQRKGRYVCDICQTAFPEQQQLTLHKNIHILQKAKYKCIQCNMTFRSVNTYEKHLANCYYVDDENKIENVPSSVNPRPFKCQPCNIAFRLQGFLIKHFRSRTHFNQLESLGTIEKGTYDKLGTKVNQLEATSVEDFVTKVKELTKTGQSDVNKNQGSGHVVVVMDSAEQSASEAKAASHGITRTTLAPDMYILADLQKYSKSQYEINKSASNVNVTVEINHDVIEIDNDDDDMSIDDVTTSVNKTGAIPKEGEKSDFKRTKGVSEEEKEFTAVPYTPEKVNSKSSTNSSVQPTLVTNSHQDTIVMSNPGQAAPVMTNPCQVTQTMTSPGAASPLMTSAGETVPMMTTISLVTQAITNLSPVTSVMSSPDETTPVHTEGPHVCGLCRQGFKTVFLLKSHLITHAELRPYVCQYCDAGFTNGKSLNAHLLTHSQGSPYICGFCSSNFSTTDEMWTHIKTQHTYGQLAVSSDNQVALVSSSSLPESSTAGEQTLVLVSSSSTDDGAVEVSSLLTASSQPDLPVSTADVEIKSSPTKEKVRLLKRQERVSSPDQEDVIVSPDQGVISPEDSLGSERFQGEVTTSSDQQTVAPFAEDTGAISDGKESTDNTIKTEPVTIPVSTNCTKDDSLLCNNMLDTYKSECENMNKSEQIKEQVTESDKSEIPSEPNENTVSALRQTERTAEYLHSYSDTMVTVLQNQNVVDNSIGIVNIPELVSSSETENPMIVVTDYPVTSEVEIIESEENQ